MSETIITISNLGHRYGEHQALCDVSLSIAEGEIFGFLGPNGSGKTTLFRVLSTLTPPQTGHVLFNLPKAPGSGREPSGGVSSPKPSVSLADHRDQIRHHIAVVFQSPSLDKQLTAEENLRHHGHLYGLRGAALEPRITEMLDRFGLGDRRREYVGNFSGGMRRRVELAKGLLTRPRIFLMDEPSTGLDPVARIEMWRALDDARQRDRVTILVTTHLMDEADRCDRLAIMDAGRIAALGSPAQLKEQIGGDVITLTGREPEKLREALRARLGVEAQMLDGVLRIERERAHAFIPQLVEAAPGLIDSVSVGKPTLEDVFVHVTGRAFKDEHE